MLTHAHMVSDKKLPHFGYVSLEDATEYGAADSHQTFKLYHIFKQLLKEKEIAKDDNILLVAFGSGLTWGASLLTQN